MGLAVVHVSNHQAQLVAWICFGAGAGLLVIGTLIGLDRTFKGAGERTANQARAKINEALEHLADLRSTAIAAAGENALSPARAEEANATAAAAKSSLDQVSSIVGSLPEAMRFPGLLVLVGALLMSVATVQFGGQSIF